MFLHNTSQFMFVSGCFVFVQNSIIMGHLFTWLFLVNRIVLAVWSCLKGLFCSPVIISSASTYSCFLFLIFLAGLLFLFCNWVFCLSVWAVHAFKIRPRMVPSAMFAMNNMLIEVRKILYLVMFVVVLCAVFVFFEF